MEEEVHGRVEVMVASYDVDDEGNSQQCSQVDALQNLEVQELKLSRDCECSRRNLVMEMSLDNVCGHEALSKEEKTVTN